MFEYYYITAVVFSKSSAPSPSWQPLLYTRTASTLLSRLPQRISLALAQPLLAVLAPRSARNSGWPAASQSRQLHVFARRFEAVTCVEVADDESVAGLKDAAIAQLELDVAPHHVRLLREVEGGAPVPLDSCKKLADQGVKAGSTVLVDFIQLTTSTALASLPAPLTFAEQRIGGELMMVARLPLTHSVTAPFYLTPLEHSALVRFLQEPPSTAPRMLMLTGPSKCGKSRILHDVLPRMLAAQHAAAPATVRRPVILRHTFTQGAAGDAAAETLVERLLRCAHSEGCALRRPKGKGLLILPSVALQAAQAVQRAGGVLWLLLDELGAPTVASTPAGASAFTQQLKALVEQCSPHARTVGTGSGVVALLTATRAADSLALWDAVTHVGLGREPAPPAALALAEGTLAAYATMWPPAVARTVTPQAVLAQLARSAHDQRTSPRPALVACLAALMGDARTPGSSPEELLAAAVRALLRKLRKLRVECEHDAAVALERMTVQQRKALCALAVEGRFSHARDQATADLAALLCEASSPPRLLPPLGAFLKSWVAGDGSLSIFTEDSGLEEAVKRNLQALLTFQRQFPAAARVAASKAALDKLASNGVGVDQPGPAQGVRAPCTLEELSLIPAVKAILRVLDLVAQARGASECPSSAQLSKALRAPPGARARAELTDYAGLHILQWIRHVEARRFFVSDDLLRAGLSSAVIKEVVQAALEVVVRDCGALGFSLDARGVLTRLPPVAERAV